MQRDWTCLIGEFNKQLFAFFFSSSGTVVVNYKSRNEEIVRK